MWRTTGQMGYTDPNSRGFEPPGCASGCHVTPYFGGAQMNIALSEVLRPGARSWHCAVKEIRRVQVTGAVKYATVAAVETLGIVGHFCARRLPYLTPLSPGEIRRRILQLMHFCIVTPH